MFDANAKKEISDELRGMRAEGLFKEEKEIEGSPGATITIDGKKLINLCSNNYLGLGQHPDVVAAAERGLKDYGLGLNSVRFIVGTTTLHKKLEAEIARFFQTEDAILYSSCFDANGGIFEVLLKEGDAVFSDELNHASIIDGIRLSKAERFRFLHNNMEELEKQLSGSKAKRKLIVTDGVFSMDGEIAKLDALATLAQKYKALLMVDDSHGSGVLGKTGRGSIEEKGVMKDVDILTSTFGKALGGAGGGFAAGRKEIIDLLRQKSRPYLFSNSLMPAIASAALFVLQNFDTQFLPLVKTLRENTRYFREKLETLGFTLGGMSSPSPLSKVNGQRSKVSSHPIIPVMVGDERTTMGLAEELLKNGVYVRGFTYPVVPKEKARIRIQISAAHTRKQLDKALHALEVSRKRLGIIK